mgnify:CR=1 FL=1
MGFEIKLDINGSLYGLKSENPQLYEALVRARRGLAIIAQAAREMPPGRVKCVDYRYTVPDRREMLTDIETLIHHFVNVTRGPRIPRGQAYASCEIRRGEQAYYVVSDGVGYPYRLRVRGPGFANVQALPLMARGETLSDLITIIGSVAIFLATINVVGGFMVTDRMLEMFKKKPERKRD